MEPPQAVTMPADEPESANAESNLESPESLARSQKARQEMEPAPSTEQQGDEPGPTRYSDTEDDSPGSEQEGIKPAGSQRADPEANPSSAEPTLSRNNRRTNQRQRENQVHARTVKERTVPFGWNVDSRKTGGSTRLK
jgi:hypothetical protein